MSDDDGQPIEIVSGKAHTDADFMEAIDQQMNVLDTKPAKKEATNQQVVAKSDDEVDEGERITVKTKTASKTINGNRTERTDNDSDGSAPQKPEERTTLSHEGKKISPITVKQEDDNQETTDTVEDEPMVQSPNSTIEDDSEKIEVKTQEAVVKEDTTSEVSEPKPAQTPAPQTPEVDTEPEPKPQPNVVIPTGKKNGPQPLKTFDTTKYHLPIKPTRHHRKHVVHPATATFLIGSLIIIVGLAAIDMEVLDIGVKLPFDLL